MRNPHQGKPIDIFSVDITSPHDLHTTLPCIDDVGYLTSIKVGKCLVS